MEEILLFANSIAGVGRGAGLAVRIGNGLTEAGYAVRAFLEPPEQISMDRIQTEAPARAVVVIGGDGTLRTVVERLIEVLGDDAVPPVLIVPLGTANLMGKHLGIKWRGPGAIGAILAAIKKLKVVHVDTARSNGKLFLLMAGVGIDGHIVHELARVRAGPIDYTSYVLPAALALQKYSYPPITVQVDGQRIFGPRPGMAFIANVREYGTGFPISPYAKSDDGLLDICVVPCQSRADAISLVLKAALTEHLDVEGVQYLRGAQVRVEADVPIPVQVDGEAAGFTPLEVRLLPGKVGFIVP